MFRIKLENILDEEGAEVFDIVWVHRIPIKGDLVTSSYGELTIESVTLLGWDDEPREVLNTSPSDLVATCRTVPSETCSQV